MHERERDRMERRRRFCDVCLTFHERPQFQAYRPTGRDFTTGDKLWMALLFIFIAALVVALTARGSWL